MLQRLITLSVWILVGWTALSLGLRLWPQGQQAPAGAPASLTERPPPADLSKLLGAAAVTASVDAEPPPPPEASRFQLLGVVAPRQPALQTREGVALLSVDGGPARAFRVGQTVDGRFSLLRVDARGAGLGDQGQVSMELSLPALPPPATGVLPGVAPAPMAAPPVLPVQPQPHMQPVPAEPLRSAQPGSMQEDPPGPQRPRSPSMSQSR